MAQKINKVRSAAETALRDQVHSAVLEVLKNKGLDKLTVQHVADAAGIAAGTVYNYFKSKDDLLVHTAERIFETIRARQSHAISAAKDPADKLLAFVETTFEFFADNIAVFNFLDQAQVYCKIDMSIKHLHVNEEVDMIKSIIDEGVKTGVFSTQSASISANFFHRAMVGTLCINPELGAFDPHQEAAALCRVFSVHLS